MTDWKVIGTSIWLNGDRHITPRNEISENKREVKLAYVKLRRQTMLAQPIEHMQQVVG